MALLFAPLASAADWVKLSRVPLTDHYYYDRSKLTVDGDDVSYWKRVVFRPMRDIKGMAVASALYREKIDCEAHTLKVVSQVYYAPNGAQLDYVPETNENATAIIPDTVGDVYERTLCALAKQKRRDAREADRKQGALDECQRQSAEIQRALDDIKKQLSNVAGTPSTTTPSAATAPAP